MGTDPQATELTAETKTYLHALRNAEKVRGADILQLIDRNASACETSATVLDQHAQDLRKVLEEVEDYAEESGLVLGRGWSPSLKPGPEPEADEGIGGLLGMIGDAFTSLVSADEPPSSAKARMGEVTRLLQTPSSSSTSPHPRGPALDAELRGLVDVGTTCLTEVDKLLLRLSRLRSHWPATREAIVHAQASSQPMSVATLQWVLQEALAWRRVVRSACRDLAAVAVVLGDTLTLARQQLEDRSAWRQLARDVVSDLDPSLAAKVSTSLWLHGPEGEVGSAYLAGEALARGLDTARTMERKLVKCAALVMRYEPDVDVVQPAVQRFGKLRARLEGAIQFAEQSRKCLLREDGRSGTDEEAPGNEYTPEAAERGAAALKRLGRAIEKASRPLHGSRLLVDPEGPTGARQTRGWPQPPRLLRAESRSQFAEAERIAPEDIKEFREWLRVVFVRRARRRLGEGATAVPSSGRSDVSDAD